MIGTAGRLVGHFYIHNDDSGFVRERGSVLQQPASAGTRRDGAALDPRGEFGLMIQWSWRIENATSILCGSWSEESLWGPTFDLLRNKVVQELSVVGRLPEIAIVLAGDLYVSSFMTAEGDPQWALFDRRGGALRTLSVSEGRLKLDTK